MTADIFIKKNHNTFFFLIRWNGKHSWGDENMTRGVKRKFEILAAERTEKFLSSWFRRGSDRKCLRQEVLVCSHIHRFTLSHTLTPNTIPTHTWQSFSAKVFFLSLSSFFFFFFFSVFSLDLRPPHPWGRLHYIHRNSLYRQYGLK